VLESITAGARESFFERMGCVDEGAERGRAERNGSSLTLTLTLTLVDEFDLLVD
jgi:hypothetical protein